LPGYVATWAAPQTAFDRAAATGAGLGDRLGAASVAAKCGVRIEAVAEGHAFRWPLVAKVLCYRYRFIGRAKE
jgi:hypothetical protein